MRFVAVILPSGKNFEDVICPMSYSFVLIVHAALRLDNNGLTFTVLLEKVVMRVTSSPVARMLYSMQSTSVAAMILAVIACGAETDASAQERSDGNLSVGLRISG